MSKLIYWIDAMRYKDFVKDNPYYNHLRRLGYNEVRYSNVHSQFPNTYRFILSAFNKTDNLERWGKNFIEYPTTESDYKPSLYKDLIRIINPYDFLGGFGSESWTGIDLYYDDNFHELMFNGDSYDTIQDKSELWQKSYELSNKFISDFLNQYEEVWIISDHGYADYRLSPEGEYVYFQHGEDLYGNEHHSHIVLSKWSRKIGKDEVISDLLCQQDIFDEIIYGTHPKREYVVTYGYEYKSIFYPKIYHLVDQSGTYKSIEINQINKELKTHQGEELTKELFDKFYQYALFLDKYINYSEFIKDKYGS